MVAVVSRPRCIFASVLPSRMRCHRTCVSTKGDGDDGAGGEWNGTESRRQCDHRVRARLLARKAKIYNLMQFT